MNGTNTPDEQAFFEAVVNSQVDTVKQLVAGNPELLQAYDYSCFGATPITRICFYENRAMLKTLLELGADVNRRSDWDMGPWSPLHSAVFMRNPELTNFLLDHGAELDAHTAAGLGRVDDLKRMLESSPAIVHEPGGDGCTPLHFADTNETAQLLMDHGADVHARCVDHYSTPVQYLADKRPHVARYLFSRGATADIFSAILADDQEVVARLIEECPGVFDQRINQETFPPGPQHDVHNIMTFSIGGDSTPMHAAAKSNRVWAIDLLVSAGHCPNVRGGYDDATPLHLAAWNDQPEVIAALLKHGADINVRSGEIHNNSPAGWAIVAGSADAFQVLMDHEPEILDWFRDDAKAAVAGEFAKYKTVPQQNYDRILKRLA